jgi:hypothetical protein
VQPNRGMGIVRLQRYKIVGLAMRVHAASQVQQLALGLVDATTRSEHRI